MIKASHPRSNSSLSGVPIAPKSSVIKSSIGVHPLIFIFLFVIIICSPFIFFLHKKSPPTQRYFHKLPLSGLRNTNKTNNILCNFLLRVMKLILFYSFLCCRAIKYKQRIFTQRDGTLFQNTEVDFYFYPTADILHFVFEVYKAFHKFSIRLAECS